MIPRSEISKAAAEKGLRETQLEKDYVIGWILYGISGNQKLMDEIAFKGGTALRKFYIKDYRLSEDLDFTYLKGKLDTLQIKTEFEKVIVWVHNQSRISLEIRDEKINTKGNFSFAIGYAGPLGGDNKNKSIKVDISDNEIICDDITRPLSQNEYSDLTEVYSIGCYSIGEIIAEKLRSLMQRTVPRDLYDIWYLLEVEKNDIENSVFNFKEKAEFKKLDPLNFLKTIAEKEAAYKSLWEKNLTQQFNAFPDFDTVWREIIRHFKKLSVLLNS